MASAFGGLSQALNSGGGILGDRNRRRQIDIAQQGADTNQFRADTDRARAGTNDRRQQETARHQQAADVIARLGAVSNDVTNKSLPDAFRIEKANEMSGLMGLSVQFQTIEEVDKSADVAKKFGDINDQQKAGKMSQRQALEAQRGLRADLMTRLGQNDAMKGSIDADTKTAQADFDRQATELANALFTESQNDGQASQENAMVTARLESLRKVDPRAAESLMREAKNKMAELQQGGGASKLTGEAENRRVAALASGRGDPSFQEAVDLTDKQKEIRSRFAGLGAALDKTATVQNIFDEVSPLVDRIFTSDTFGERIIDSISNMVQKVTQEGNKATDLVQYDTVVQGVVGQIRSVIGGEKGVMTEKDAERIVGLFPNLSGPLNLVDGEKAAKRKMLFLQGSLDREVRAILKEKGFTPEEIEAKFDAEEARSFEDDDTGGGLEDSSLSEIEIELARRGLNLDGTKR